MRHPEGKEAISHCTTNLRREGSEVMSVRGNKEVLQAQLLATSNERCPDRVRDIDGNSDIVDVSRVLGSVDFERGNGKRKCPSRHTYAQGGAPLLFQRS